MTPASSPRLLTPRSLSNASLRRLRRNLLAWYDLHRRPLPWRETQDPYRIWISEVMLQQTRVAVVRERYTEFVRSFPDVSRLARAPAGQVLAAWSGLGYYRRARSLHAAAKIVCRTRGGVVPRSSAELRALPGIGRYTAAALASIAFGEPVAAVDGNVARVVSRLFGGEQGKMCWERAQQLLCVQRPGDFNQAMMELGATVCLPAPRCAACPISWACATRAGSPARPGCKRTKREVSCCLATLADKVFLERRPHHASLMPGMWQLPEVAGRERQQGTEFSLRHSITNIDYLVHVTRSRRPRGLQGRWIRTCHLQRLPLTGLTRKILRRAGIIQ